MSTSVAAKPRVLYLGPADMYADVQHWLQDFQVEYAGSDDDVDSRIAECAAVLDASMRIRFPAARLARAQKLKLYVTATTGADHVDGKALADRGIPLLTLKGQRELLSKLTPAAEHSWLLLMSCARQLRAAVGQVLDGEWDRTLHPGTMLRGKTLGLIGCGRIGGWMARYASAFGMRVVGFDPHTVDWPEQVERRHSLEEVLREGDFVSVHVPLTEETAGLLGRPQLEHMKPRAVLVNTSRGEIVDEAALLDGLLSGRIGAAGLDVLTGEPHIHEHPLVMYARSHHNLVITPHIGGFSPDAVRTVLEYSCGRIRSGLTS